MMMAEKIATTAADLGSAPQSLVLRRYRPLIVVELSNEAVNGLVTLIFVGVAERFDDLIDPLMRVHNCCGKKITLHPLPLGDER